MSEVDKEHDTSKCVNLNLQSTRLDRALPRESFQVFFRNGSCLTSSRSHTWKTITLCPLKSSLFLSRISNLLRTDLGRTAIFLIHFEVLYSRLERK